ncbi:hypothetical protein TI83_04170 [Rathayibacter toxicus]|nr:hypothetical protein TI83_04170 [Rathayibacter toxicus]
MDNDIGPGRDEHSADGSAYPGGDEGAAADDHGGSGEVFPVVGEPVSGGSEHAVVPVPVCL